MFLPKLYKYSRGLFWLFAGFLLAFVFINIKQGAVSTPVYQYGMFSEPFLRDQKYEAYQFVVDGDAISLKNLSFPARDVMLVSLQNYLKSSGSNEAVYNTMHRIAGRVITLPVSLSETASPGVFNRWYVELVSKILKTEFTSLEVIRREVKWSEGVQIQEKSQKIFPVAE